MWAFDAGAASWQRIAAAGAAPEPRFGHVATYDRSRRRIVVALGQGGDNAFFNNVWAWDAGGWTQLDTAAGDRPQIRYGSGGALDAAGSRLLISHGFTDRGRFDDSWSFDLGGGGWHKVSTSGSVPIKRCLTRCLWLPASGEMLLFGGQTDSAPFLGDFWLLDLAKGVWSEQRPSPVPGPRTA